MQLQPYIARVLAAVRRIYPKEYPQIEAMYKAYEVQIPKIITEAQVNRALKVCDIVTKNLETLKDDMRQEEEELEDMGIEETE